MYNLRILRPLAGATSDLCRRNRFEAAGVSNSPYCVLPEIRQSTRSDETSPMSSRDPQMSHQSTYVVRRLTLQRRRAELLPANTLKGHRRNGLPEKRHKALHLTQLLNHSMVKRTKDGPN